MPTKDEEAEWLARKHYEVEPGLTHVFRLTGGAEAEARPTEPIKLLEVNQYTVPSGLMPLYFGPSPASGLHYPTVILEITPEEFEEVQSGQRSIPNGWEMAEFIPRPVIGGA